MSILTRFSVYWGSALGVFISHLPARNPLGKCKLLSKDGCQVPFEEKKILMIDFLFLFLAAWERETSSILSKPPHRSLQHTHSLLHLVCFILLKEWCSPTLILFQRVSVSTTAALPRKEKIKG